MDDPIGLVRRGYDAIAPAFLEWRAEPAMTTIEHLGRLRAELRPGARVLDLGCGPGTTTANLGDVHRIGVDLSAAQLSIARTIEPALVVVQADMTKPLFRSASLDAVVALFSIIHVPRRRHDGLLREIASRLRPGAPLVATLGVGDNPGDIEEDWLGAPMYWSGFDADTNLGLLANAGFDVEDHAVDDVVEDGEPVPFLCVYARRR